MAINKKARFKTQESRLKNKEKNEYQSQYFCTTNSFSFGEGWDEANYPRRR
jgi:hypothetical protein